METKPTISQRLNLGLELMKYQEDGIRIAVKKFAGRSLIADEMGLGKTVQGLVCAVAFKAWPLLVVCPASLRLNWKIECEKWISKHVDPMEVSVIRTGKDKIQGKIVIMSYDLAAKKADEIAWFKPRMVVLDEAHYIKNRKALRTKALVPICKNAPYAILLTGTPVLNRPRELWTQLEALKCSFGDYWGYARRYCNLRKGRFGWDDKGASNIPELNQRLLDRCMVRRLKADVLKDLPPKRRVRIVIDNLGKNPDEAAIRAECLAALNKCAWDIASARAELRKQTIKLSGMIFKAYSTVGLLKAEMAAEWVVDNSSLNAPLVVFAHHTAVLDAICAKLKAEEVPFGRIDGSTPLNKRQQVVNDFQAGKLQAAVLSITAASTGLTLTRAYDMLICELPFGPGLAAQAEDRIHRIGQKNAAMIRYMIVERTIDDVLWRLINSKSSIAHGILDGRAKSSFDAETETTGSDYWNVVEQMLQTLSDERSGQLRLIA